MIKLFKTQDQGLVRNKAPVLEAQAQNHQQETVNQMEDLEQ